MRGYKVGVAFLTEDNKGVVSYEPFLDGFIKEGHNYGCGRPVDIIELPDGSILVSDDYLDKIFRVTYVGNE